MVLGWAAGHTEGSQNGLQVRGVDQAPYQQWHDPLLQATSYAQGAACSPAYVEVLHLFRCYTRTHLIRTVITNFGVECILRAKTLPLNLPGGDMKRKPMKKSLPK